MSQGARSPVSEGRQADLDVSATGFTRLDERLDLYARRTVPVVLAQTETTLYFTKTHLADLKVIIKTNGESTGEAGA